jgi:hypothetical protein
MKFLLEREILSFNKGHPFEVPLRKHGGLLPVLPSLILKGLFD